MKNTTSPKPTTAIKPFVRKPPTYHEREMLAFQNADRIQCRVRINGQWREKDFFPEMILPEGRKRRRKETVREVLQRVHHALRHNRDFANICLYVVGPYKRSDGSEELMKAAVPHDFIPDELKR